MLNNLLLCLYLIGVAIVLSNYLKCKELERDREDCIEKTSEEKDDVI